jgi:hypothetical protein
MNRGGQYHLEIRQRNKNIIRLPLDGSLFQHDSEIVRDEIRTFLSKGGVDAVPLVVLMVPIGIQNQNSPHDDDHAEDSGGGDDAGDAGPHGGDGPEGTELCCEDVECCCCCCDLC